jgi:hypothetical protein
MRVCVREHGCRVCVREHGCVCMRVCVREHGCVCIRVCVREHGCLHECMFICGKWGIINKWGIIKLRLVTWYASIGKNSQANWCRK